MRRMRKPLSRAARLTKEWMGFDMTDLATHTLVLPVALSPGGIFAGWILPPSQALDLYDEPTVLRMRISVVAGINANGSGGGLTVNSWGIIAATDLPGLTSLINDPLLAAYADWLWWTTKAWANPPGAVGLAQSERTDQSTWDDVRTKRRLDAGQGLALVGASEPSFNGAAQTSTYVSGRILLAH